MDGHEQQRVLDSALPLLALRGRALDALARGRRDEGAEIVASGNDLARWTLTESLTWRELLSTRPVTRVQDLARSLLNNRAIVGAGLRMRSVFDAAGTAPAALGILREEPLRDVYLTGPAPLQMRIVDRRFVLVRGPSSESAILRLSTPAAVDAALEHWAAVLGHTVPCAEAPHPGEVLSAREGMVLELLRTGATDRAVATWLGVSVRTVQSDVAGLMQRFGVGSRFALGHAAAHVTPLNVPLREHADHEPGGHPRS